MQTTSERIAASVRRLGNQGRRYLRSLIWLVGDSLRVAPRCWTRIGLATIINLASNFAVAGAIYFYVDLLQRDSRFELLGLTVVARQSPLLLLVFVGATTIAILAFAASDYAAKAAALRMNREYQAYSLQRSLRLLQRLPDARCPQISVLLGNTSPRKLISTYPHGCGWSLRFIGYAFPNLVLLVVGYLALVWLDPSTTALLTALGLGVIAAQYPVHLLAARSSNIVEETASYVNQQQAELLGFVSEYQGPEEADELNRRLERYARNHRVHRHAVADEDRYRAMELSALFMQTGGGLILALMVLTIGLGLLSDTANWAILLVYVTLLRRLLNSVTAVFRTVSVFSRFSPQVQAYGAFVRGSSAALTKPEAPALIPNLLPIAARSTDTDAKVLTIARGVPVAVYSLGGLSRDLALTLQRAIFEASSDEHTAIPDIRSVSRIDDRAAGDGESALEKALDSGADVLLVEPDVLSQVAEAHPIDKTSRILERYLCVAYGSTQQTRFGESVALVRDRANTLHCLRIAGPTLSSKEREAIAALLKTGQPRGAQTAADAEEVL